MIVDFFVRLRIIYDKLWAAAGHRRAMLYLLYIAIGIIHTWGYCLFWEYKMPTDTVTYVFTASWMIIFWPIYFLIYSWKLLFVLVLLVGIIMYSLYFQTPQRPRSNARRSPW